MDAVKKVMTPCADYDKYYENNVKYLLGTSLGNVRKYGQTEHIHMELLINDASEQFVAKRLMHEGRNSTVIKISDGRCDYDVDLFYASETSPWVKTFLGRIIVFETSNQELQEKFDSDIQMMHKKVSIHKNCGRKAVNCFMMEFAELERFQKMMSK